MEWLILALIVLWAVIAVVWMIRRKKSGKFCCGGCSGCSGCHNRIYNKKDV